MVQISKQHLVAKRGQSNVIHGTDQDDSVKIHKNVKAHGSGASNVIHLYDGDDTVWIGGQMQASGGRNSIFGDNGQKNITIKCGLEATKGGINEIILADTIAHFTATHHLTIGSVKASHKGRNIISTGGGDDHIAFTGHFNACYEGQNIITLGDGSKNVNFARGMDASHGGKNIIHFGVGNQIVTFGGSIKAGHNGENQILTEGGNVFIHVKCDLEAKGINNIQLGEGSSKIIVGGNMIAHAKGINHIAAQGENEIVIGGTMKSHHGLNHIETGMYDADITIRNGMKAHGGSNIINTGEGNDAVFVKGKISADKGGKNIVQLGDGNDVLYLYAHLGRGDLTVDGGDGYDVLSLSANNTHKFNNQYKAWFSDMYHSSALSNANIEEVRIDIDCAFKLGKIDWLTQMINNYNDTHSDEIAISLVLDSGGARINLGDIFTSRDESSIAIIDLGGKKSNELRIHNTLAANGYDADELRIDGDSNDRVGLDNLWSLSGGIVHDNENYYYLWENSQGESLLIQDGIDIHVY